MSLTTWGGTLPLYVLFSAGGDHAIRALWILHLLAFSGGLMVAVAGVPGQMGRGQRLCLLVVDLISWDLCLTLSYIVSLELFEITYPVILSWNVILGHYVLTFLFLYVFLAPSCSPNSVPIRSDPGGNAKAILLNTVPQKSRGSLFGIYTIMDDLGKGLGPALVASWVRAMGRTDAFKCLGRKRCHTMPWGGGSIFHLGGMFSYEPVWYTNCIDSLWASCWAWIWRYLKFAVALCWTPRLGILFWLPCGLFCLLMTCTILRDDLSEFCDAREFPMAEINSSESSTRASASASPSGSQVDSPVWWPALQVANMSDWAICIMLVYRSSYPGQNWLDWICAWFLPWHKWLYDAVCKYNELVKAKNFSKRHWISEWFAFSNAADGSNLETFWRFWYLTVLMAHGPCPKMAGPEAWLPG